MRPEKNGKLKKAVVFLVLHFMLFLLSVGGICSKLAAGCSFPGVKFCMYYGCLIMILGIYAVGWQQVIKYLPLSFAFANKAVTVIWGTVWGCLIFRETLSVGKAAGIILVVAGIVLYSAAALKQEP